MKLEKIKSCINRMNINKKIKNITKFFEDQQNKSISILIAIVMFTTFYLNNIESITIEKEFKILLKDEITLGKFLILQKYYLQ